MTTKERLEQYIEKDRIYQEYKQNKLMNVSDFDKFCIQHCSDIETLLKENKQLKERIAYLERSNNRREDTIIEQRQEISNLEDNCNKLKEIEKDKIILDKDMFDYLCPIGTIYYSYDKEQKFPYGEWEYRGCNSMAYFFKRIK